MSPTGAPTARSVRLRALFEEVLDSASADRDRLVAKIAREEGDLADELRALLVAHAALGERLSTLDTAAAARLLEETPPEADGGGRIGRFELRQPIGRGGMGVVYLGYDPELDRQVALKVLYPLTTGGSDTQDRLLREARAASRLEHPGIATVYDVGRSDDGRLFMAMPYYDGRTLAQRIAEGPIPVDEAVRIGVRIAEALGAAHAAGVVHRDIKPANVMLLPDGSVRVLDFGVARTAEAGPSGPHAAIGTVAYMSPEQTRGAPVDGRSDLWSLAVVLWEMIEGVRPFVGKDDVAVLRRIRRADLPDTVRRMPAEVGGVLRRCLRSTPAERFPDAASLADALRTASAPDLGRVRRRRVVGSLLAVAAGAVALFWLPGRSDVHPAASLLAVLPFAPTPGDTSLARLGRELAVTVAMNLEGVGGIRVLDPLTVLARADLAPTSTVDARRATAAELGATGVVSGAVVRLGDRIRVDMEVFPGDGADAVARASVVADGDALISLTDSISWALLRGIWRVRDPPSPSLAGITTGSFASLRAFLEGERAIAEGRFREAPGAFERAILADSTFWLAYWRLIWTRGWYGQPVDPGVREAVALHLDALPPRDSALAAAGSGTLTARYRAHRAVVSRFPGDWLAWFVHQDLLVHDGGYLGRGLPESREALEHVVRLNPELVRGWDHLFWVAREQRDTVRMRQVLARLGELGYDSISLAEGGFDDLEYFGVQNRATLRGGRLTDADLELGVDLMTGLHVAAPPLRIVSNVLSEGLPRGQIQISEGILDGGATVPVRAAAWYGKALALAAQGRWREAEEAARAMETELPTVGATLFGLQITAVGAALGVTDPGRVSAWATRFTSAVGPDQGPLVAEGLWLQGLAATAEGRTGLLDDLASRLAGTGAPGAPTLGRSLAALRLATVGDTAAAADALRELAMAAADSALHRRATDHPFHGGVVRLLAARWTRSHGDPLDAAPLLSWYEAVLPDADGWSTMRANRVLEPVAHLERVYVEDALGRPDRASWHLGRAEELLDGPDASLASVVAEARKLVPPAPGPS